MPTLPFYPGMKRDPNLTRNEWNVKPKRERSRSAQDIGVLWVHSFPQKDQHCGKKKDFLNQLPSPACRKSNQWGSLLMEKKKINLLPLYVTASADWGKFQAWYIQEANFRFVESHSFIQSTSACLALETRRWILWLALSNEGDWTKQTNKYHIQAIITSKKQLQK